MWYEQYCREVSCSTVICFSEFGKDLLRADDVDPMCEITSFLRIGCGFQPQNTQQAHDAEPQHLLHND